MRFLNTLRQYLSDFFFLSICFFFSFWLMFHTFSYSNGSMVIAGKAWSDFASHVPLIRSFSLGDNFPPEFPLFPGEPIRYHFLFYALVGLLERLGLPIDLALNVPSALSFFFLILMIFLLAKFLFQSRVVAILSVVFFLLNGSLAFLEFFKNHPLSLNIINDIASNPIFPSFGPYDGKVVSAFWNLNIYTNQRHLALPIAFLLLIVYMIIRFETHKKPLSWGLALLLGALIGILPLSHSSLFIMAIAVLSLLFLLLPQQRLKILTLLIIAFFVSLPRIYFIGSTATFIPHIQLGYLIYDLTFQNFITYWVVNLGIFVFMIPLGFLISQPVAKRVLLAFFSLFIIGNVVQFSPEIASNHKFFNVFLIVGNILAAYAVVRMWHFSIVGKALVPILIFFMILSGIIDFFPIKNDGFMELADYPKNPDVKWIVENTPKDAVFLNYSYLYHPASLAGRKIFLGWPYFPWSLGYNTYGRDRIIRQLYELSNFNEECQRLKENDIDYLTTQVPSDFPINYSFFENNFYKVYDSTFSTLKIYRVQEACDNV